MQDFEADNAQVEAARSKAHKEYLYDLRDVLSMPQGQRVFWRLMADNGLMASIGVMDAENTQRLLGRRDVALSVYGDIMEAAPGTFLAMLKERTNFEQSIEEGDNDG